MKRAEDWLAILNDNGQSWTITVRQIQADALRHAVYLCQKHDGLSILAADHIEKAAAELDPK